MSMELGGLQSLETIIQIGNMSEITNIEDAIKSKKVREKLTKEKDELELEILILQKKLVVVEGFLDGNIKDVDWHNKPPMSSADIKKIYEDYMKNDYWKDK